ncbi:PadR family transcriptional regulator [Demequina sp. NBRC 110053]|uniref:PadR family transcriptional regulator n=1 Tax=Demequina sp. NBRC 110053 TaxID=1570342 RepID=UPI000A02BA35|nr:PadR family transcriptional regulator [Demequina sp. NBRC 110053]
MDKLPALLGLMSDRPTHGYDLKHRYDEVFAAGRPLAFGQLYATIARMLRDGLIVTAGAEVAEGPERKRYEVTDRGREHLRAWLRTPDDPTPALQTNLFAKTVLALMLHDDAEELLDVQRASHLAHMRALTSAKAAAPLLERLAIDHALFQIEADLRWIDLTGARLTDIRKEIHHG